MIALWIRMRHLVASLLSLAHLVANAKGCILLFFIFLGFPLPSLASSSKEIHGWLGTSLSHFSFAEYDSNGDKLLEEKGFLPGIQAGIKLEHEKWFLQGKIDLLKGDVDYKGQTNTGISLLTETDETIMQVDINLGNWLAVRTPWRFGVYGELGYRWWLRDIHSTDIAEGISETYTSWFVNVGVGFEYTLSENLTASINGHVIIPIDSKMEASLPNRDTVSLDLQEKIGFAVSASFAWKWSDSLQFALSPSYYYWRFGRSGTKQIFWKGFPVGTLYEPDSKTKNISVKLNIIYMF